MLGDREQVLANRRMVGVELRQCRVIPPPLVAEYSWVDRRRRAAFLRDLGHGALGVGVERSPSFEHRRLEMEPVAVGRLATVLEHVMERPEPSTAVVEDAVEDDPHPASVGLVEQFTERRVAAQQRVDRHVVVRVVAVVRCRGEDRREVQRGDAEVIELVQALGDAEQIAALEPVICRRRVPVLQRPDRRQTPTPRKSVGKDLVEDGLRDPVRNPGTRSDRG